MGRGAARPTDGGRGSARPIHSVHYPATRPVGHAGGWGEMNWASYSVPAKARDSSPELSSPITSAGLVNGPARSVCCGPCGRRSIGVTYPLQGEYKLPESLPI